MKLNSGLFQTENFILNYRIYLKYIIIIIILFYSFDQQDKVGGVIVRATVKQLSKPPSEDI